MVSIEHDGEPDRKAAPNLPLTYSAATPTAPTGLSEICPPPPEAAFGLGPGDKLGWHDPDSERLVRLVGLGAHDP